MNRNIKKVLEEIAKKYDVSLAEVEREIEIVLTMAQMNPDPNVQTAWDSIPRKGDQPTTEEVIAHIAKVVSEKL